MTAHDCTRRQFVQRAGLSAAALATWPWLTPRAAAADDADAFEVVVIGGTPGGIAAAVTAARLGRRVALTEMHPHLGAMSASGLGKSDITKRDMIQGLFREFVDRVKQHYLDTDGPNSPNIKLCRDGYYYEPSVAERIFEGFIAEQPTITVLKRHAFDGVQTEGKRITAARLLDLQSGTARLLRAGAFIDATYEGDVYAAAGAPFRLGRESRDEFNEPHAGNIYVDLDTHQIIGGTGEADQRLPAYTYRLCLSTDPDNQVPLTAPPADYDRTRYLGYVEDWKSGRFPSNYMVLQVAFTIASIPNHKTDVNMKPISLGFAFAEENVGYIQADRAGRARIAQHIRDLTLGLLWFLQHDPDVPADHREKANRYHLAKDEFADNGNFPFQLYVREGRRLIGQYTLTEHDITIQPEDIEPRRFDDAIAMGEFPIDSFPYRKRQPGDENRGITEGYLGMMRQITRAYQIPYRIMVPQSLDGLLAPVAASTTHVAFSSIRLEPTWMALGQAAGVAVHLSLQHGVELRDAPIADMQEILRQQGAVLDDPAKA
ncbi:MAG: FAD-dependent oxidoreductase [Phycisphaeraceae bacterium]|nr:FAD-dependent oxidoreductase [Phycisphaeraceae bacterium]